MPEVAEAHGGSGRDDHDRPQVEREAEEDEQDSATQRPQDRVIQDPAGQLDAGLHVVDVFAHHGWSFLFGTPERRYVDDAVRSAITT